MSTMNGYVMSFLQDANGFWKTIAWTIFAIFVFPCIWRPIKAAINRYRLEKRMQKYPSIVVLEVTSKPKRSKHSRGFLWKTVLTSLLNFATTCCQSMVSIGKLWVIHPLVAVLFFLLSLVKHMVSFGWVACVWLIGKSKTLYVKLTTKKKKPLPPSVLRKSKEKWEKTKTAQNEHVQTSKVRFDDHSTGSVKNETYYYNPFAASSKPVDVQKSQTPPKTDHRDETTTPVKELSKTKQRIQTPPPKRWTKKQIDFTMNGDKENATNGVTANSFASLGKGNPKQMLRQDAFMETPSPTSNRVAGPNNKNSTPSSSKEAGTPLFSPYNDKQPLSAQVRKRRMEGEILFSPSSKKEGPSNQLTVPGQQLGRQPKRRKLLVGGKSRKNQFLRPPRMRPDKKREREERLLEEFNRKPEKRANVTETNVVSSTPQPTATPNAGATSTTSVSAPAPPAFSFGSTPQPTTSADSAAPATTPSFSFGQNPPAHATDSKSGATEKPAADGKPAAFVFGASDATTNANSASSGDLPKFNFNATPSSDSISFGTNTSGAAGAAATTTSTPASSAPAFSFGANKADDANPAANSAQGGDSKPFVFGTNNNTGAAQAPAPATSTIGFGSSSNGATPADAPAAATGGPSTQKQFTFGSSTASGTQTSAPASNFSFGADKPGEGPAPASQQPFSFGANTAGQASGPGSAPSALQALSFGANTPAPAGTTPQPFSFGTNAPSQTPAPAGTTPQPFSFGTNAPGQTPAPAATTQQPFSFGTIAPGQTPASAATAQQPVAFGSNNPIGATPAPGVSATPGNFSFGTSTTGAKPDPPASNVPDAPKATFAFGSTASNTPQPGMPINNITPTFGMPSNPPAGGQFLAAPVPNMNSNAGATPAFLAPSGGGFSAGSVGGASARRRQGKQKGRRRA